MIHEDAIPIHLDRPRHLLYTIRAGKRLSERLKEIEASSASEEDKGVDRAVAEVWAGLLHEDPGLTVEQLEDILTPAALMRAQTSLAEAFKKQVTVGEQQDPPVASEK